MKDSFEEFINGHREEFEVHEPPASVWRNIERKQTPAVRPWQQRRVWQLAATVAFILVSFAWFTNRPADKCDTVVTAAPADAPEMTDLEFYYRGLVGDRQAKLMRYRDAYPDLYADCSKEVSTLGSYYAALKQEYASTAGGDVVKQAMIENLQSQVQVMDEQLQIIKNIEQRKYRNNNS